VSSSGLTVIRSDTAGSIINTDEYALQRLDQAVSQSYTFFSFQRNEAALKSVISSHQVLIENLRLGAMACGVEIKNLLATSNALVQLLSQHRGFEEADSTRLASTLWTYLGGNKGRLSRYTKDIALIDHILNSQDHVADHSVTSLSILNRSKELLGIFADNYNRAIRAKDFSAVYLQFKNLRQGIAHLEQLHISADHDRILQYIPYKLG
jgi:hypothetical protein